MNFTPWFAYDCMIAAVNEGRWQSAFDLASALIAAAKTPGSGAPRWFRSQKWMNIVSVEHEARKHGIDTAPKGVAIVCPPSRSTEEERPRDLDSAWPSAEHPGAAQEEVREPELHRHGGE